MQSKFGVLSGSLPLLAMHTSYLLPVVGGYLLPCSVSDVVLTPTAGGHRCNRCPRLVHDFTQATAAEVAQARAAAPDGQVCGRFAVPPTLSPVGFSQRLRWFVVALVLVVGRGLSAQQALAQVQRPMSAMPVENRPYGTVEQYPSYKGGQMIDLVKAVQKQFRYSPVGKQKSSGKLYVSFQVNAQGKVRNIKMLRGSTALVDSAAIRVIRSLDGFEPGTQNGLPVPVSLTVIIQYVKPE